MRAALLVTIAMVACAPALPAELPAEATDGLLRDAVLLPLTTQSSSGLLGRVWSAERRRVDGARQVVKGEPLRDHTRQHIEVLRSIDSLATLGTSGGGTGVGVDVGAHARTDVAYSVDVTGYETLDADATRYGTESGCCVNGVVAGACEGGFVGRVLRGSGKLRYLRRLDANASAGVGPILRATGGMRYELLDETTFEDAFFAIFPEPLADLCAHVTAEQELSPIHVVAAENCTLRVYTAAGGTAAPSRAMYFPSKEACFTATEQACADAGIGVVACPVTYREADGSVVVRDLLPDRASRVAAAAPVAAGVAVAAPVAAPTAGAAAPAVPAPAAAPSGVPAESPRGQPRTAPSPR